MRRQTLMAPLLFVFGTLRDAHVLELVLGRDAGQVSSRAAWLDDHATVMLPEETYPVLEHRPGVRAHGRLLALDVGDLERIAFFEGEEYGFDVATVVTGEGALERAILCGDRSMRPGRRHPWSLEEWQRVHKDGFLPMARIYMTLFGSMTIEEADAVWRQLNGRE